jgi:hypothetical protein
MNWLRKTDFYRKIPKDLTEGTACGGSLSIFGSFFMIILFILEFYAYLSVDTMMNVQMDTNADALLRINFNVTMTRLPCQYVSIDVSDVLGVRKVNMTKNIRKWKVSGEGKKKIAEMHDTVIAPKHEPEGKHPEEPVERAPSLNKNNFKQMIQEHELVLVNFFAPWCYWSQRLAPTWHHTASVLSRKPYGYSTKIAMVDCTQPNSVQLCHENHINAFPSIVVFRGELNSHEHYHGDRTTEAFIKFIEGIRDGLHHETAKALGHKPNNANNVPGADVVPGQKNEPHGCLISGFVMVKKVPGSLSIAAHSDHHTIAANVINTTHNVHHFSFGKVPPRNIRSKVLEGAYNAANRLGKSYWITGGMNMTHEHYIKVVSTEYHVSGYDTINAYKYSVNSHQYRDDNQIASAKFTYDLSPMSVILSERRIPLYHFLTSICAIIGGVFTVIGLLDSVVYIGFNSLAKKQELGKAM